jgi:DNA polymerase
LVLEKLIREIKDCKKCSLWKDAENAVPGEGPDDAKVMLVGQNPGEVEDKTGKPFVGRAGKFLNLILDKNDIKRERLFITNVVKHKTPNNRKPNTAEIQTCMPYLIKQINEIRPEIVVLLGRVAWQTPRMESIKYVETYHPAAAMRFPRIKEKFENDFKALRRLLKSY